MRFAIHKKPGKVLLLGLLVFGLYFSVAAALLRGNKYYFLILGAGFLGVAIHLVKSIGSAFVSSLTVTEDSIETVTWVGGIIKIRFDDLDWEQTSFSGAGLVLIPRTGEPLMISVAEYSLRDIARLAHHIASSLGVSTDLDSHGEA